ncbi:MAG: mannose-1-phosphate guanylyltransferase, partial [Elusimicrobiota bacterium]
MLKRRIYPVIIAGGAGERFWPLSRKNFPKQFLDIFSNRTMIEETLARVKPLARPNCTYIVTGTNLASLIRRFAGSEIRLLNEPVGKNTAPAIALAAAHINHADPQGIMVVLPADHIIKPAAKFISYVRFACELAHNNDSLVTFGIKPLRPETGYGYIELGKMIKTKAKMVAHSVKRFREKPGAPQAKSFIKSGNFLWNSGMFVWSVKTILKNFQTCMPKLYSLLELYMPHIGRSSQKSELKKFYENVEKESIDYGVMQKAKNIIVVAADFFWDDVGDWKALPRILKPDKNNNIKLGGIISRGCDDSIIVNKNKTLTTSILNVKDITLVVTKDAILLASN